MKMPLLKTKSIVGMTCLLFLIPYIMHPIPTWAHRSLGTETGLPIPRFVSTKDFRTNIRTGPGKRYPIRFIFEQRVPIMIIDEYHYWRKIRDWQGEEGWVYKSLISAKRLAIVRDNTSLYAQQDTHGRNLKAYLKRNVIVILQQCSPPWCYVTVPIIHEEGYLKMATIWGVSKSEILP